MNQVRGQVMDVIIRSPDGLLEEGVLECLGFTSNQVFCELDRMSRAGHVRLTAKEPGLYAMTSTTACEPCLSASLGLPNMGGALRLLCREARRSIAIHTGGWGL
jgi:hypothetical protein